MADEGDPRRRGIILNMEADADWLILVEAAMNAHEWEQQDLAKQAKVSTAAVSRMYKQGYVTDETATRVADALGVRYPTTMVQNVDISAWLSVGTRLLHGNPPRFAEILAALQEELEAGDRMKATLERPTKPPRPIPSSATRKSRQPRKA